MATGFTLFTTVALVLISVKIQAKVCPSPCPNINGYIENCLLNKPENVIEEKPVVSQLQCFDNCFQHSRCFMYNYKKSERSSCQLLGGIWSFDDENSLLQDNMTVFSWLNRDHHLTWTMPTCEDNTCPVVNYASNGYCQKPLDIAFLLDTSIQNAGEFNETKQFVANVLQKFKLSPEYTKVGLVDYNTHASISFSFNDFTTASRFFHFLSAITHKSGQTRYDRALHKTEQELFSSLGGARPFAHRVIVLIADNELSKDAEDKYPIHTLKQAMKKKCIHVFAVGIANGRSAASNVADSKERHLLRVEFFNQLVGKSENFAKKICTALP